MEHACHNPAPDFGDLVTQCVAGRKKGVSDGRGGLGGTPGRDLLPINDLPSQGLCGHPGHTLAAKCNWRLFACIDAAGSPLPEYFARIGIQIQPVGCCRATTVGEVDGLIAMAGGLYPTAHVAEVAFVAAPLRD